MPRSSSSSRASLKKNPTRPRRALRVLSRALRSPQEPLRGPRAWSPLECPQERRSRRTPTRPGACPPRTDEHPKLRAAWSPLEPSRRALKKKTNPARHASRRVLLRETPPSEFGGSRAGCRAAHAAGTPKKQLLKNAQEEHQNAARRAQRPSPRLLLRSSEEEAARRRAP